MKCRSTSVGYMPCDKLAQWLLEVYVRKTGKTLAAMPLCGSHASAAEYYYSNEPFGLIIRKTRLR